MSSPPPETETCDVELSREERWVTHHVLTTRADEEIENGETPPEWVVDLFETIEAGEETFTIRRARDLHEAVTTYADREGIPERDAAHATAVADRLEAVLD
ncbi:hypothetical protein [Salinilacihabitans rarus]|uniref:DUF7853 family protein n=1 Tax=Salinilacihabitans rarus TaxID=2961596 RepID=UPI0020C85574|nr:hypothetical protein [Salinilacihabitans rarus]